MSETLNANSLIMNAMYGINSTYNQLAMQNNGKVSFSDLQDFTNVNYYNMPFLSYLQNNFSSLDTDQDGSVTATEMQQLLNQFQTNGLTYSQLMQLCSSGGMMTGVNTSELSEVLANFQKIDKNSDGKVSMAEINSYNTTEEMEEKKEELVTNRRTKDMSIFYSDSVSTSSSSDVDEDDEEES